MAAPQQVIHQPFKLDKHEAGAAAWQRVRTHLEQRLEQHRRSNDNNLSPEETAKLRGRIAEIKYLLTLDQPTPAVADDR